MNKNLNNILTYYFGRYKQSDDYRLQKATCKVLVSSNQEDFHHDNFKDNNANTKIKKKCNICDNNKSNNKDDNDISNPLISCDKCNNYYHLLCLKPELQQIPD